MVFRSHGRSGSLMHPGLKRSIVLCVGLTEFVVVRRKNGSYTCYLLIGGREARVFI